MAKLTVLQIYTEVSSVEDDKERKLLVEHARRSESEQRLKAMVELAKSEQGIPVLPHQLDADPFMVNVLNGTIDLRSGKLRVHARGKT